MPLPALSLIKVVVPAFDRTTSKTPSPMVAGMIYSTRGVQVLNVDGVDRFEIRSETLVVTKNTRIAPAFDRKRGFKVVLKISSKDSIQREMDIYHQLEGIPGLPMVYGWCLSRPSFSYISMEPFTQDLYRYVEDRGPMCLRQACEVAETVLSVLSSAHSRSVIHSDIKPQNIVCSPDEKGIGKLAVIDWGLASKRGSQNTGYKFFGTPAFMSLSRLSGHGKFLLSQPPTQTDSLLTEPHPLDDVESLSYLIEFLHTADVPWGWPTASTDADYEDIKEERRSWTPENPSLQEFLAYARDQRSDDLPNYVSLQRLLDQGKDT